MGSLSGVTVVDFTRQLPGPFASRELLRLGARVVKIEPPEGDLMPEGWYRALNDGKEIVSWDARTQPPPGGARRRPTSCSRASGPASGSGSGSTLPATTILCSITGYGAGGPRAQDAGPRPELPRLRGRARRHRSAVPPVQIADLAAGAQSAVIEVLAALLERERSGRGARIVVSMTHASHRFVAHRLAGDPVPRLLTGGVACYRIYETADGRHLTVAALEPKFWRNLCELIERPDLVDRAYEPELPELDELFRSRTLHDWRALARGQGHLRGTGADARRGGRRARVNGLAALAFALLGIHVGAHRVLPVGYAPAWSPDGQRIAFVTRGDLWVADADGTHTGELVADADQPAWSPNGRRLAFARDGSVWTIRADGLDERRLAVGAHPAWSPDGERLAFDRDGEVITVRWYGGDVRTPARARIRPTARTGSSRSCRTARSSSAGASSAAGTEPAWSPSGKLAWVSGNTIYVDGHAVHAGQQPAWRPASACPELLPDFDQRAPTDLTIAGGPGRWLLGFTSLVDNIGLGPVRARRRARTGPEAHDRHAARPARERQGAHLRRRRAVPLHELAAAPPLAPDALRQLRAAHARRAHARPRPQERLLPRRPLGRGTGRWPGRRPHFLGDCGQYRPEATRVVMGTTPGYTDRYPAFFHGQNVDITNVPAGVYDLTHRVNASMQLRELRYDNDAASVRLRLTWRKGYPRVRVLRSCPATANC